MKDDRDTEPTSSSGSGSRSLAARLEAGRQAFRARNRRVEATLARLWRHSLLARAFASVASLVRHSRLYAWLAVSPDAGTMVVDLRETTTLGPVVALLGWVLRPLVRAVRWPGTGTLGARIRTAIASSRVRALLATLLGPPEPPDES